MHATLGVGTVLVTIVIEGKGLISIINEINDLIEVFVSNDRHNGSEDLVSHNLRVEVRVVDDSGLDVLHLSGRELLSSVDNVTSGSLDASLHSVPVQFVDHLALFSGSSSREDFFAEGFASINEGLFERLMD